MTVVSWCGHMLQLCWIMSRAKIKALDTGHPNTCCMARTSYVSVSDSLQVL